MDETTFIIICGTIILGLLAMVYLLRQAVTPKLPTYIAQDSLFTPAERNFMLVLEEAAGSGCRVYGKVRLADVLKVRSGMEPKKWRAAFNKICAKHVDFVVCDAETLEVLCVVELDDSSHAREDRTARDVFFDEALKDAEIPLMRVKARASYNPSLVREQLVDRMYRALQ